MSIGSRFYPQNELKIVFYQFYWVGCCLRCATASEIPSKNIKSCYLRVFLNFQSSKAKRYPQFDHKYQIFSILVIALGPICDAATISYNNIIQKNTQCSYPQLQKASYNVYGNTGPSFMLSSIINISTLTTIIHKILVT